MTSKRLSGDRSPHSPHIVINDSSFLIDLRKADLLQDMLELPYQFAVALPVQQDKMLGIAKAEWEALEADGLDIIDLDPAQVAIAFELKARHAALSAVDCFSLSLARSFRGSILLTGDAQLGQICEQAYGVEVRDVVWVTDQL